MPYDLDSMRRWLVQEGACRLSASLALERVRDSGKLFSSRHFCADCRKPLLKLGRFGTIDLFSFEAELCLPDAGRSYRTRIKYETLAGLRWRVSASAQRKPIK